MTDLSEIDELLRRAAPRSPSVPTSSVSQVHAYVKQSTKATHRCRATSSRQLLSCCFRRMFSPNARDVASLVVDSRILCSQLWINV